MLGKESEEAQNSFHCSLHGDVDYYITTSLLLLHDSTLLLYFNMLYLGTASTYIVYIDTN